MKKTAAKLSIAFVLVFIAGFAVGTVAHKKPKHDFGAFLAEKLDLTDQQHQQMKAIWSKTMGNEKTGRHRYKELREQRDTAINNLLKPEQLTEYQAILDTYKEHSNELRQLRHKAIENAVSETKKILTPKQQELYENLRPDKKGGWHKPPFSHRPNHKSADKKSEALDALPMPPPPSDTQPAEPEE